MVDRSAHCPDRLRRRVVWTLGPGVGPGIQNWEQELLTADQPKLRLFNVPNAYSALPERDCDARWMPCTPETARRFSATAYFFGRELAKHLDCKIGLVESDWGGTVCEAWTSLEGLRSFPEFGEDLDRIAMLMAAVLAMLARRTFVS